MAQTALPSHRQFCSTLIDAIAQPEPPLADSPRVTPEATAGLSAFPHKRHLLLTLHVIFPALLLPALDLLDRKLVQRLVSGRGTANHLHLLTVRPVASTTGHRNRGPSPGHIVHIDAWSCSCAAFALDAYRSGEGSGQVQEKKSEEAYQGGASLQTRMGFGGLSRDGDHVPCCKHLLACFLAEKWGDVLGGHVETRTVTREELAVIVARL